MERGERRDKSQLSRESVFLLSKKKRREENEKGGVYAASRITRSLFRFCATLYAFRRPLPPTSAFVRGEM